MFEKTSKWTIQREWQHWVHQTKTHKDFYQLGPIFMLRGYLSGIIFRLQVYD